MHKEINSIARHLFHKENLENVSLEELDTLISRFPYVAPVRFLIAKKKHGADRGEAQNELVTASLYFHNPLWMQWQIEEAKDEEISVKTDHREQHPTKKDIHETDVPVKEQIAEKETPQTVKTDTDSPLAFQSYHTIDYFASQGIRLQQADLTKDRLGQQLKSFTEWLRSMKKLPSSETEMPAGGEDVNRQQNVIRSAAYSIEEKEVLTEAMAEVWEKQGNTAKALEIYEKLSLLNPGKSGYFAAKIEQLK